MHQRHALAIRDDPSLRSVKVPSSIDVESHRLHSRTLRLAYRREAADELQRIVQLEQVCCAFLDFSLAVDERGHHHTMSAVPFLSIGALARQTGCTVPTIRYYEEIGLLPAAARTEGGQRHYGEAALRRLSFIRR